MHERGPLVAGTSMPNLFASVEVARRSAGDMAVSNVFGCNVFTTCVALGVPWLASSALRGGRPAEIPAESGRYFSGERGSTSTARYMLKETKSNQRRQRIFFFYYPSENNRPCKSASIRPATHMMIGVRVESSPGPWRPVCGSTPRCWRWPWRFCWQVRPRIIHPS